MIDKIKKTTALNAPVAADAGQSPEMYLSEYTANNITDPLQKCNNDLEDPQDFIRRIQRAQDPMFLNTFSYNELMDELLPCRRSIIEGLLGTGAYILAGAPKIGKSFLVALIAYSVSTGTDLWGYKVQPGIVLLLALEDDKKRLQDRMARMFGVEGTDKLRFATEAGQVGKDLEKQLENFILENPDTVLIIVDTLQKVREMTGDSYSYASDYEVIGRLKQFADSYNICVLIVHHTRKQPAGDNFEMISGTTGLLGCADGALLMKKEKRTDSNATLELVSRDQPDQKLYLEKNQESLVWELDHAEAELWKEPPDPLLEKIAKLVTTTSPEWIGSPTELAGVLGVTKSVNQFSRMLNVRSTRLWHEYNISYENVAKHSGRKITLHLISAEYSTVDNI